MPQKRITFYPSFRVTNIIKESKPQNLSSFLSTAIFRYAYLAKQNIPQFTGEEWVLIFEALEGEVFPEAKDIRLIPHQIEYMMKTNMLDKKWNIDERTIMAKLTNLNFEELVSLVYILERFWFVGLEAKPDKILDIIDLPSIRKEK